MRRILLTVPKIVLRYLWLQIQYWASLVELVPVAHVGIILTRAEKQTFLKSAASAADEVPL